MIERVFLDCGHGPFNGKGGKFDPGAQAQGTSEYAEVSKMLVPMVQAFENVKPTVVRTPELSIQDVVRWINSWTGPPLSSPTAQQALISVHMNEGPAKASGIEVVYSYAAPPVRKAQAEAIGQKVAGYTGLPFRGVVIDSDTPNGKPKLNGNKGLPMLRDSIIPAFILELGFISNKNDLAVVRKKGGTAIAETIRMMGSAAWPQ